MSDELDNESDHAHRDAQAASKGCVVLVPEPDELFVDLDTEHAVKCFARGLEIIASCNPGLVIASNVRPSPSGILFRSHGFVRLSRPVKDDVERILLQAMLGSDPIREILSWRRIQLGIDEPTVFFEKPDAPHHWQAQIAKIQAVLDADQEEQVEF